MGDLVRLETEGAVAVIRLDRPPVNALNRAMHGQLSEVVAQIGDRPELRAAVLYGGSRAFAAGADIKEMAGLTSDTVADFGRSMIAAFDAIAELPIPVVAAVTGYALGGGCELALTADLRVMGADARIGLPEITLGVIPGVGGTQRLSRLIGPSRAKDLIFSGRALTGTQALDWGLVNRAVPGDQVLATAMEWATRLAAGPTAALAAAKRAVDRGLDGPLADGLALESRLFSSLFDTDDQTEGMRSFLAEGPGKARFTGR